MDNVDFFNIHTKRKGNVKLFTKLTWTDCRLECSQRPTDKNIAYLAGMAFMNLTEDTRKQIHNYLVEKFVKYYDKAARLKEKMHPLCFFTLEFRIAVLKQAIC